MCKLKSSLETALFLLVILAELLYMLLGGYPNSTLLFHGVSVPSMMNINIRALSLSRNIFWSLLYLKKYSFWFEAIFGASLALQAFFYA